MKIFFQWLHFLLALLAVAAVAGAILAAVLFFLGSLCFRSI